MLAMRDPEPVARLRSLEQEIYRPDYCTHIVLDVAIVYFEVAKAASSTIHSVLGSPTSIRSIGPKKFFDIVDSPGTFVFSFVRNPYTRLVSCYKDKFARYPVTNRLGCMKDAHRYFGRELRRLPSDEPLPLPMFVELACATNKTGTDGHWLMMDRMIPKDSVRCHFIGRVERINEDLGVIEERVGRRLPQKHLNKTNSNASVLTPELRQKVYNAYRGDFERFEYSPNLS